MLLYICSAVVLLDGQNKPNREIHKSTENKCTNKKKGYDSTRQRTGGALIHEI